MVLPKTGHLLTGDCRHHIYHWQPTGGSTWSIDKIPFKGHKDSVEDLQWSPSEDTVFASCSVDKTVRIWDTRCKKRPMLTCSDAHDTDVNVIKWNRLVEYLIVSGSDDGSFKIWDLRNFKSHGSSCVLAMAHSTCLRLYHGIPTMTPFLPSHLRTARSQFGTCLLRLMVTRLRWISVMVRDARSCLEVVSSSWAAVIPRKFIFILNFRVLLSVPDQRDTTCFVLVICKFYKSLF